MSTKRSSARSSTASWAASRKLLPTKDAAPVSGSSKATRTGWPAPGGGTRVMPGAGTRVVPGSLGCSGGGVGARVGAGVVGIGRSCPLPNRPCRVEGRSAQPHSTASASPASKPRRPRNAKGPGVARRNSMRNPGSAEMAKPERSEASAPSKSRPSPHAAGGADPVGDGGAGSIQRDVGDEKTRPQPSRPLRKFTPRLYLVATPIGNAEDITVRALKLFAAADVVACDDTRVTARLLALHAIHAPLTPYHD